MRGTFFQKPFELVLDVEGEAWKQGDVVKGKLRIKNNGTEKYTLKDYGVKLGFGPTKKIRAKDIQGLEVLGEEKFEGNGQIKGGEEKELLFNFGLAKNSPISESSAGLFLLCGEGNMLELNVSPHKTISNLFVVFENLLRFKVKSLKNQKDSIEATMIIPTKKEYTSIQQLKVLIKMIADDLDLVFKFKLKKISFEGGGMKTEDKNLTVKKSFSPKDYLIYGDSFNQEKIFNSLKEIIEEVKVKPLV